MKNKQPKRTITKAKKQAVVAEFSEKVAKARAMVMTNYQGMTHKQLEELKKALKKADAELVVTKNTLLLRAFEIGNLSADRQDLKLEIGNSLAGPTATLFAYSDPVAPLKELAKTIKALKLPLIKLGILDGKQISSEQVNKLSTLPPKEVLLAQFVGTLNSPISGLVRALNWNMQKLVMTLNAIQQSKSQ